jgi:nucleoside-diphosphate-sugar epimerase
MYPEEIVLLGENGVIGSALYRELKEKNVRIFSKSIVESWIATGKSDLNSAFSNLSPGSVIINCVGLVDPLRSLDDHHLINYEFPKNLRIACDLFSLKLVTFGSILEDNEEKAHEDRYLNSKNKFSQFILGANPLTKHLHLQLHTIYGGVRNHPNMFIEQIRRSILLQKEFCMSSGEQIREFHHVADEATAIIELISQDLSGIYQVNAGNQMQIKELANRIFLKFNMLELLKFDHLLNKVDVFNVTYKKLAQIEHLDFREPIAGVIDYIERKS